MALFNIDPAAIGQTLKTTAAGRIAQEIAQSATPHLVRDVQRVLNIGSQIGQAVGLNTGIGVIDRLFGAMQRDSATPLLGGLSMRQAQAIYERASAMRLARKNLFFVRITDPNSPLGVMQPSSDGGAGGLSVSRIGPSIASIAAGVTNSIAAIAGGALSGAAPIADMALSSFDILCLDVNYTDALTGDSVQIGSGFMDSPTGRSPTAMQLTTMDDEAGTIKKWFRAKMKQVAADDGTFGLPSDYLITIEVVHAVPLGGGDEKLAYSGKLRMRAGQMQHDLSRRDQGLAEVQLTFEEADSFLGA